MDDLDWTRFRKALAGELEAAGRSLDEVAAPLCLEPLIVERFGQSLQTFDRIAQIIGEIATTLKQTGSAADALSRVRLDAVRNSLTLTSDVPMEQRHAEGNATRW